MGIMLTFMAAEYIKEHLNSTNEKVAENHGCNKEDVSDVGEQMLKTNW